jgi:hypothetical protein
LARRCAALSRQLASKPAIKAAKALRQIPHTSFRSTASESGKSPKPLDYSRNPR